MSDETERAAWADYWTSAGSVRPACLPNARNGVEAAQRRIWSEFSTALKRRAKVLDIGTGDGAVLKALAVRRDLELTGVDNAPVLPKPTKGIRLKAGVAAEDLPFPGHSFDAVVSQFGFEYAEIAPAAAEAGRILREGGMLRMIVHHRDGPIVAHNRARRDALLWLIEERDLLGRARTLALARRISPLPTPAAFRTAIREAQLRHGPGSGADELAEAVWRTLETGRGQQAGEVVATLDTLAGRAGAEILRIDSLLRAARDEQEIGDVSRALGQAGVAIAAPRPLFEEGVARPFAWLLDGRKIQN